jgi:hypothetical protein
VTRLEQGNNIFNGHLAEMDIGVICVKTSLSPPPPNEVAKPAGSIGGTK